eukprot:Plantae.Rhodophyta-Rhodochaete_pulchella.ctg2345.p1 GENE.Plantae.Rhodophyta-Rhodochaete_pulchella.ctg2345~~Plantae.Rhodophyta-Rhodochaete_pulchella.ctg2345.p1  ORF type:complete len:426 (-),score=49.63 Plantae.Rhodophyta-Rhodochaete_pulchella.ctg2345:353-1630(-)
MKVAQLAGYVAEKTAYHHGEVSLHSTIVKMAQNFVGSNNLSLLEPLGQFGTRLQGGKDAASARYIFTRLTPAARLLFPEEDEAVLSYNTDDGESVEPEHYVPIIPLVLVNGASGIGTGWKTDVPLFNPRDVIANIRRKLAGQPMLPMGPWVCNFKGDIVRERCRSGELQFLCRGKVEILSSSRVRVTELPVGMWTETYRDILMNLTTRSIEGQSAVVGYKEFHTDSTVNFEITMHREVLERLTERENGLTHLLRLESKLRYSHMFAFDVDGRIRRFNDPLDIIEHHIPVRLRLYNERKAALLTSWKQDLVQLENRVRFAEHVVDGSLAVAGRPVDAVVMDIVRLGLQKTSMEEKDDEDTGWVVTGFKYLLKTPLWQLTQERISLLRAEASKLRSKVEALESRKPGELWSAELDRLEAHLSHLRGY